MIFQEDQGQFFLMGDSGKRGGPLTRPRRALAALFAAAIVLAGCAGCRRLGPQRAALSDRAVRSEAAAGFAQGYRLQQRPPFRYPYFLVGVRDVRFNSWFNFWFDRSTCTGDTLLSWFSQGDQIWIPRTCLAEPRTTG